MMEKELDGLAAAADVLRHHVAVEHQALFSRLEVSGLRNMLADNREGMDRIRSVTRDLLLFSRVEHGDVDDVDLNDVVRSTVNLLGNELRHRARVTLDLHELPPIAAERSKLAQVVTNLLLNAAQAIVEGDAESNDIRVSTRRQGDWLVLAVTDSGMGLSDQVKARMFEPFFTTKARGEGTGMGLSLRVEIVKKHGGELRAEGASGRGARLELRLPLDTGMRTTPLPRRQSLPAAPASRRPRRILVIDDDAGMVRAYRRLFAGHDAVIVASGAQALAAVQVDARFDLVLCDLMMPDMDGPQVYDALAQYAPHLLPKLVFCTGGAFTPRAREFLAQVSSPVLDKPLDLARIENILARLGPGGSAPSDPAPDLR
jgi:CheY-like chemotaxis protein